MKTMPQGGCGDEAIDHWKGAPFPLSRGGHFAPNPLPGKDITTNVARRALRGNRRFTNVGLDDVERVWRQQCCRVGSLDTWAASLFSV